MDSPAHHSPEASVHAFITAISESKNAAKILRNHVIKLGYNEDAPLP